MMAVPSPKSSRKHRTAALSLSLKQSAPAMSMPGDPPELGLAQTGRPIKALQTFCPNFYLDPY